MVDGANFVYNCFLPYSRTLESYVNLTAYLNANTALDQVIPIDIVGFSRGAAEARDFANQVIANYKANRYRRHCLQFRFMGLFDTVSQFGAAGSDDGQYNFSIAPAWHSVAQAYALNEHRELFPLRTIQGSPAPYIERGFIGSHSDIGGGYLARTERYPGDLSDVTLMWMIDQGKKAGLKFTSISSDLTRIDRAIVHDERGTDVLYGSRDSAPLYDLQSGLVIGTISPDERDVIEKNGTRIPQALFGLTDTRYGPLLEGLIRRPSAWTDRPDNCAGTVDMKAYREWLLANYNLNITPSTTENVSSICAPG
jgi:hypothetical protein